MASVLFMGASSTGKTTHITMLDRGLRRLGASAGRLESSYYLSTRLIVGDRCPGETDLTLSITVRRLVYEVQSRRVEFAAVDYDGHSHIGAASFLSLVASMPEDRVAEVARASTLVAGSLLGRSPLPPRGFVEAYNTIMTIESSAGRLADVYWSKLARSLGVPVEDYPAERVNREFTGLLRLFDRVDASAVSVAANLAAARVLESMGGSVDVRVISDPEACIYTDPHRLASILEGHLHSAPASFMLGVEPGEHARTFYLDFLTLRLAVTGALLGMLLLGFHAMRGENLTLNILHPADMASYSITYARKQAFIDVASGALRLDPSWAEALEEVAPLVEEASWDPEPGKVRRAAAAVDRVRRSVTLRIEPVGKSLSAFPVNAAKVLGGVDVEFAERVISRLVREARRQREAHGILEAMGGWAARLAAAIERLEAHGSREARELAAAVRGLLPVELLVRYSVNATFYTHTLMVSNLLSALAKAAKAGAVDARRLRLLVTLSYLDRLYREGLDAREAYLRAKECVSIGNCEGVASYRLLDAVPHEPAEMVESGKLFGRGWYIIPGGYLGEARNEAFTLAISCLEIIPAIYPGAGEKLEACRRIAESSRVPAGEAIAA